MPRQTNTKEKIIESAFSLYARPRLKEISLGEIAAATGISKTAIFRHFKNKEELIDIMRQRFLIAFDELIQKISVIKTPPDLNDIHTVVNSVFEFNENNSNYLNYFLQTSFCDEIITSGIEQILLDHGISVIREDIFTDEKNLVIRNLIPHYLEITLLNFMVLNCTSLFSGKAIVPKNKTEYRNDIARLVYSGLGKKTNPVSPERRKELDKICRIELSQDETQNRFFEAFVKVVKESKDSKITVEKIADALGIAKSTIYSFFNSKIDFVKNMRTQETKRIFSLLDEKCNQAKNTDEALYILMRTESNYFTQRQQVLMLHAYFIFRGLPVYDDLFSEIQPSFIDKVFPEHFFESSLVQGNRTLFIKWISGLTVAFMAMSEKYNFPPVWTDFYIPAIFEIIECGIKFRKDGE